MVRDPYQDKMYEQRRNSSVSLTKDERYRLQDACIHAEELPDQLVMRRGENEDTLVPTEEKYEEVQNRMAMNKPSNGFWTSSHTPHAVDPCDWARYCEEAGFLSGRYTWKIRPKPKLAVYEIEHESQINFLENMFSRKRKRERSRKTMGLIDFEKMSAFIDGLRVSRQAARNHKLNSWDAESTVWFTYPVDEKEFIGYYKDGRFWKTEV